MYVIDFDPKQSIKGKIIVTFSIIYWCLSGDVHEFTLIPVHYGHLSVCDN